MTQHGICNFCVISAVMALSRRQKYIAKGPRRGINPDVGGNIDQSLDSNAGGDDRSCGDVPNLLGIR